MRLLASRGPADDEFVEFVHTAWPSLYRTAVLLAGEHALAEDLVQTALAKTYVHWHRIRDHASARGYARRVLVNATNSWFRKRSTAERPVDVVPDRLGGGDPAAAAPERIDLVAALADLSPRQRAVIVLRYYEDLSVAATAEQLRISTGTVKSQTSAALSRLRALLGDEVDLPDDQLLTTTGGHHA